MKAITLKDARERAGFTQDQLADAADVPQSVISRLENGKSEHPAFSTVVNLAKALSLPVEALLFGQKTS